MEFEFSKILAFENFNLAGPSIENLDFKAGVAEKYLRYPEAKFVTF